MPKYKIKRKSNDIQLIIKLSKSEILSEPEYDFFSKKRFRGLVNLNVKRRNKLSAMIHNAITLDEYLKSGISNIEFFGLIEQYGIILETIENQSLDVSKLFLDYNAVFINFDTNEMLMLYLPIDNSLNIYDEKAFFYSMIKNLILNKDSSYDEVNRFSEFVDYNNVKISKNIRSFISSLKHDVKSGNIDQKETYDMMPETVAFVDEAEDEMPETVAFVDEAEDEMPETVAFVDEAEDEMPETVAFVDEAEDEMPETVAFVDEAEDEMPDTVAFVDEAEDEMPETVAFVDEAEDEMPETVAFVDEAKDEMPETVAFVDEAEDEMPDTVAFVDETKDKMPETFALEQNKYEKRLNNSRKLSVKNKVFIERVRTGEVVLIDTPEFIIGKSKKGTNYIVNDNNTISRFHAKIVFENNQYFLIDLGSSNHSFIEGVKMLPKKKYRLYKGTRFLLSNEEFIFIIQ